MKKMVRKKSNFAICMSLNPNRTRVLSKIADYILIFPSIAFAFKFKIV